MKMAMSLPMESRAVERTPSSPGANSNLILLATLAMLVLGVSTLLVGLSMEVLEHTASTLKVVMQAPLK